MSFQENLITPTPKLAWGGAGQVLPNSPDRQLQSFKDLMSEDLAQTLNKKEQQSVLHKSSSNNQDSPLLNVEQTDATTSTDFLLANVLQEEYNKEYDRHIQRQEEHFNKNSKLSVSYNNFKICADIESSFLTSFPEIDEENRAIDSFEERKRKDPVIPPCGYIRHNKKIVTKHDTKICERKNAERVMNLPPEINTGDGGGFHMNINNRVYNNLNQSAISESKRKLRYKDKSDKAITDKAMDRDTKLTAYKMINSSALEGINGIISMGKESVVFNARGGIMNDECLPEECAVKVFKTTLTDFKTRERYIRSDYRFKDRLSKNNNKMMIQMWAEKEFHNLKRLQKATISAPLPYAIKDHVLIMSFIGANNVAAPKIKDINLLFADWCIVHEQVEEIMVKMFRGCNLVHGDMSEYNLLWHDDRCWVIDVSQAVEPTHPNALKFLLRDCSNIVRFFKKKGLTEIGSSMDLFEKVSGIHLPRNLGDEDESNIEIYESNQELWREGLKSNGDPFEHIWSEILKDESSINLLEHHRNPELSAKKVPRTASRATPQQKSRQKKLNKKKATLVVSSTEGDDLDCTEFKNLTL